MEIKTETKTIVTTVIELNEKEAKYLQLLTGKFSKLLVSDIMAKGDPLDEEEITFIYNMTCHIYSAL